MTFVKRIVWESRQHINTKLKITGIVNSLTFKPQTNVTAKRTSRLLSNEKRRLKIQKISSLASLMFHKGYNLLKVRNKYLF